ncbi:MAG: GFA family protein [Povalibacter sp.]
MTIRRATCSCGQLQVTTRVEPIRVSMCHCIACQRRTGSVFGLQARFPRSEVNIEGRATQYTRVADSGQKITFSFCPECGATVHYFQNHLPDIIAVPVGAFGDPAFPSPAFSVYESRMHPWLTLNATMEHHD